MYLLWIQDLTLNGENELALKYVTKGEKIALENKTSFWGYGNLLKNKAQVYRDLVKYDSAFLTAEALIDASRTHGESELEIQGHVEKGTLQMHIGDDAVALQTFLKAIELCQKTENESLMITPDLFQLFYLSHLALCYKKIVFNHLL